MLSKGVRLLCLLLLALSIYIYAKESKAMFRSLLAPLSRSARTYASQATAIAPGAVEGFVGAVGNTPLVSFRLCGDFSFWLPVSRKGNVIEMAGGIQQSDAASRSALVTSHRS